MSMQIWQIFIVAKKITFLKKNFLKQDMYFSWICYNLQGNQLSFSEISEYSAWLTIHFLYKHTFHCQKDFSSFWDSDIKSLQKVCFPLFFRLYSLLHLGGDNDQSISVHEGAEGVTAAWLARRSHISRIPNGGFHAVNFRQIMAHILHDTQPMYVFYSRFQA